MIRKVKGTRDILPPDSELWVAVEGVAHRVFGGFGYDTGHVRSIRRSPQDSRGRVGRVRTLREAVESMTKVVCR